MSFQKYTSAIGRFRNLLKVDRKEISQVYVYALFNGLVNLSLPVGIQAIINLIQGGEISTSWIILVGFVIIGIALTGIFQLLQLRIVENIAQNIFSRASFEFAFRIPKIRHSALRNYYAPELANRFFDTMTIQKGLSKILIDFSLALFQIIVGLVLLSFYHSFFILFSLILIALVYTILAITGPKGLQTSLKESSFKYKIAFWLEEIARTRLSFKLISKSNMALERTDLHVSNYLQARESHFKVLVRQFLFLIGFKVIIAAGLLITGSILVFNQEMNIGQFVAAEIIIILIIASVEKLIISLDSIYDVLTALEKIGYITDMQMDSKDGLTIGDHHDRFSISFKNVCFSYPNAASETLTNITFNLPEKTSLFIEGPSNAGKSTLLQLLAGIYKPTKGIILYNNFPLKSIEIQSLLQHIGFVLHKDHIFQGTILDNIQMGREGISADDLKMALKIARLTNYISSVPLGLNTELDPEGKKIPMNIQNRILLARAIAAKPSVLIMEDPLDHVTQDEKESIIQELINPKNPWSILVASIDPLWKKFTQEKIYLDNGILIKSTLKSDEDVEYK